MVGCIDVRFCIHTATEQQGEILTRGNVAKRRYIVLDYGRAGVVRVRKKVTFCFVGIWGCRLQHRAHRDGWGREDGKGNVFTRIVHLMLSLADGENKSSIKFICVRQTLGFDEGNVLHLALGALVITTLKTSNYKKVWSCARHQP